MVKIRTFWQWLAFEAGLVLASLGIVYFAQVGIVRMIFGEPFANAYIYPAMNFVLQGLTYAALTVIVGLGIAGPISYLSNRGKRNEPSDELKETIAGFYRLETAINRLTDELRAGRNGNDAERKQ